MTCYIQFTHRRDEFLKGLQSLLQSVRHEQMSTAQTQVEVQRDCSVFSHVVLYQIMFLHIKFEVKYIQIHYLWQERYNRSVCVC